MLCDYKTCLLSNASHDASSLMFSEVGSYGLCGFSQNDIAAKQVLGHQGTPPAECTPAIMHDIVRQHMEAPSVWAIFPLQVCLPAQKQSCSTLF